LRYARLLATANPNGSRREELGQLLWYRYFLDQAHPDIVHVQHPLERAFLARKVMDLERRRWPLVITAHSFFGEHEERVIRELMAPNLRAADRVIAVSPHIADQAASLGVDRQRIRVIRSGVDMEGDRPRDRAAARARLGITQPLVLFVGNLEPRKQVPVLLQALTGVHAELALVGDGDERDRLRMLARELGIAGRVRFVGRVGAEELHDWYVAADVFALPSSSEAQGIVALEAMANGLPVVASAVGGLLGTIDDGRTGFLVPPRDSTVLAERLRLLLDDESLRHAIGAAARAHVQNQFTWQRAAQATFEVYQDLLACRHA
jgi:glycosyltransferase involved in cell wall biosynthesis